MDLTVMHINKGNAHGTQGERSNGDNSDPYRLLRLSFFSSFLEFHSASIYYHQSLAEASDDKPVFYILSFSFDFFFTFSSCKHCTQQIDLHLIT